MIWIQLSLQGLIFSTGSSSARGNDFFSSDRLASWFGKTVAKKGYKFEKNRGDQLKKGGASERGSILWHWAFLSRGECQTHMITLIFLLIWRREGGQKGPQIWKKMRRWSFENKRWCLSGKEVPSCDTGPSSAEKGQTHIIKLFFSAVSDRLQPPASSHTTCYIPSHMLYTIQHHTII